MHKGLQTPRNNTKEAHMDFNETVSKLIFFTMVCFGDFNEILYLSEKKKGNARDINMISKFGDAINECSLTDLGCTGRLFTWSNQRYGPNFIEEILERFLCNKEWGNHFHELAVTKLESWTSDHSPIIIEVVEKGVELNCRRKSWRRIHYEDM